MRPSLSSVPSSTPSSTTSSKKACARADNARPHADACADGPPFIELLFNTLRTKSYLPYAPASPGGGPPAGDADGGIPLPVDALAPASRKRALEDGDYPIPKGPRVGGFQNGRQAAGAGMGMGMGMGMGPGMGMAGTPGHTNPNRQPGGPPVFIPPEQMQGVCRDYHGQRPASVDCSARADRAYIQSKATARASPPASTATATTRWWARCPGR
jgi:hypothetical protein